jgi:hypothetical protein
MRPSATTIERIQLSQVGAAGISEDASRSNPKPSRGPAYDVHVGAGFQRLLQRLGRAGVKRLGLLRKLFEQIAEIEQADQRHDIRRDRGAGDHPGR